MVNLELIGFFIKNKANNQGLDQNAITALAKQKGFDDNAINEVISALDKDEVLTVSTLNFFTPVNPITYRIGIREVHVEKRILRGLFKNNDAIGIKTIDNVKVEQGLIRASVVVVHSDQSEVNITSISKNDAKNIETFLSDVIEAQRAKVVNLTSD